MTAQERIRHKLTVDVADAGTALATTTALEELIEPAADAVSRFQAGAVWRVEAYYIDLPDPAGVAAQLEAVAGVPAADVQAIEVPDENWVAISQAALPPVVAGRFTVHGSHDRSRIPRGPWAIEIDAGEAFGTAHHATTLGCLMAIDRLARRGRARTVLDLGCGSGVLAIAAQRVWPSAVVRATDIDPEAVRVAGQNAHRNRAGRIRVAVADGLPALGSSRRGRFDLVIANILAGPLIALAPKTAASLRPGGGVILSGLLNDQAPAVRAAHRAHGLVLVTELKIAGWSTLILQRARPTPGHQQERNLR